VKPGELICIFPGSYGYPVEWKRGEDPMLFSFPGGSTGILLEVKEPHGDEPRTFLKVITSVGGISWINSEFCREV
jgi:hypothetical protein